MKPLGGTSIPERMAKESENSAALFFSSESRMQKIEK
jgi:hypothetical protein